MKKTKVISVLLCLSLFSAMALGSGSSSTETKAVTAGTEADSIDVGTTSETTAAEPDITIDEQVLLEAEGIKITATEYTTDDIWGDGIRLLIENSSSRNVTVGCTALIVNNYMITDLFASDIAAGMNANETLYLSSSELEASGINTVGQIETYFHIFDSDTYDEIYNSDCITIQTSAYADMTVVPNDSGTVLYNENGIKIVGKTVDENSFWGTAILLYIENTSGQNICVQAENMAINGFMVSPVFSSTVYDGKMAIDDITIFSSDLENNGITSIDEVSLTFHIVNADSYSTITDTDAITFSAQ